MQKRLLILRIFVFNLVLILLAPMGCKNAIEESDFKIDFENYTLSNGLEVILHQDTSDPVVSVVVQYHVGSNRDVPGRTGFAHLFEHMMLGSTQHVSNEQTFEILGEVGGDRSASTTRDGTSYFLSVSKNALETALWLEADNMGFLRPAITQESVDNQKSVVKNELRQRGSNRPYGHTEKVLMQLLYPPEHPYYGGLGGSMKDVTLATVKDALEFHERWYLPNNATLAIAGDFERDQTKVWIKKYFEEIESVNKTEDPGPQPVALNKVKMAYYEDNFAKSPELNMRFPTVELYHPDSNALTILAKLLSSGKKSPLYNVVVKEKKLAPSVFSSHWSYEITGEFGIRIRAFPDVDLDYVRTAVLESFQRFEKESFTEVDAERIKAGIETDFYKNISDAWGKAYQLAWYSEYAGSPEFITTDLENIKAVTKEDILRVYEKYIRNKPYVITSFVPKGKTDLAVENSEPFTIVEEAEEAEKIAAKRPVEEIRIEPIPSSFDRNIEPPKGPNPKITPPVIWEDSLANGLKIYGIEHTEIPLLQFSLTIQGGQWLDNMNKVGVANIMTKMMMGGTQNKTPIELEEAIADLGADISINAERESITIQVSCLSSKFSEVFPIVEEILLEPRWDEEEFSRLKQEISEGVNRMKARPEMVAEMVFDTLIYGDDHIFSIPLTGTNKSIQSITIADLMSYYERNISPTITFITIVGNISQDMAVETFRALENKWAAKEVSFPNYPLPSGPDKPKLFFVDIPGARQSVIRIGKLAMPATDSDYDSASVMNSVLHFSAIQVLFGQKGYAYRVGTEIISHRNSSIFTAFSWVQPNATLESVQILRDLMLNYSELTILEKLESIKNAIVRWQAVNYETLSAKLSILNEMATYGFPNDYIKQREEIVKNVTLEEIQGLAQKYINPDQMIYLVVGDGVTQMKPLEKLGLGEPIRIEWK